MNPLYLRSYCHPPDLSLPAYLSLNSGFRSLFLVAVFLLLAPFLSGSRSRLTYGSAPSLEQAAKALWET